MPKAINKSEFYKVYSKLSGLCVQNENMVQAQLLLRALKKFEDKLVEGKVKGVKEKWS